MKKYNFWVVVILLLVAHFADTCSAVTGITGVGTSYLGYNVNDKNTLQQVGAACNNVTVTSSSALFITPSNVGITNKQAKNAVLGFINEDKFTLSPEVCIRVEAHLDATTTAPSSLGYSWLSVHTNRLGGDIFQYNSQRFTEYACFVTPYGGVNRDDTNLVLITSLNHLLPSSASPAMQTLHYDIVWVTAVLQKSYKVCWQDIIILYASHSAVIVDTLVISKSDDNNSADYVAGKIEFGWPGEDEHSGFCIIVPFATPWEIPPVMFATLENPGAANLITDQTAGVFIWVENVSTGVFEICGSHVKIITASIPKTSLFTIHYFGVPFASTEAPQAMELGKLVLNVAMYCDDFNYPRNYEWRCDMKMDWPVRTLSVQSDLFVHWLAEGLRIPRSDITIDFQSFDGSTSPYTYGSYHVSWKSLDAASDYNNLQDRINAAHDAETGILNYNSDIWRNYLIAINYKGYDPLDKVIEAHVETDFSTACAAGIAAQRCSKQCDGGESGTFSLQAYCGDIPADIVVIESPYNQCNVAPCSGDDKNPDGAIHSLIIQDEELISADDIRDIISSLKGTLPGVDPPGRGGDPPPASIGDQSSNAFMIATIVLGILLSLVIVGIVIVVMRSRERSTTFGNVGLGSVKL